MVTSTPVCYAVITPTEGKDDVVINEVISLKTKIDFESAGEFEVTFANPGRWNDIPRNEAEIPDEEVQYLNYKYPQKEGKYVRYTTESYLPFKLADRLGVFLGRESIDRRRYDSETGGNLSFSGFIEEIRFEGSRDGQVIAVTGKGTSKALLEQSISIDSRDWSNPTSSNLIIDILRLVNERVHMETNLNVVESAITTTTKLINYVAYRKKAIEVIKDLCLDYYTGGGLFNFFVDNQYVPQFRPPLNSYTGYYDIWYPAQTNWNVSHSSQQRQPFALAASFKKGFFKQINTVHCLLGKDFYNRDIEDTFYSLGDPYGDWEMKSIVKNDQAEATKLKANLMAQTSVDEQGFPTAFNVELDDRWVDVNGDPIGTVTDDGEWNDAFRTTALYEAEQRWDKILEFGAEPAWEGDVTLWGNNYYEIGLKVKFSAPQFGLYQQSFIVSEISQDYSIGGWTTTLTLIDPNKLKMKDIEASE